MWFADNSEMELLKILINTNISLISLDCNFAISWACSRGYLEIVKYLLSLPKWCGVSLADRNYVSISYAFENGRTSVVKYILSSQDTVSPTFIGDLFISACKNGYLKIVEFMLNSLKKFNDEFIFQFGEAMKCSCLNGHLSVAVYLFGAWKSLCSSSFQAVSLLPVDVVPQCGPLGNVGFDIFSHHFLDIMMKKKYILIIRWLLANIDTSRLQPRIFEKYTRWRNIVSGIQSDIN